MDLKKTTAPVNTITYNKAKIEAPTGNIYEAITIIAKRANQINTEIKKELLENLDEFATYNDSLEEIFENKEQIEVVITSYSIHYTKLYESIVFILASSYENYELILLTKPIILPSIFFAYYTRVKGQIDIAFTLSLVMFFIGDMFLLIGGDEFFELILVIFLRNNFV